MTPHPRTFLGRKTHGMKGPAQRYTGIGEISTLRLILGLAMIALAVWWRFGPKPAEPPPENFAADAQVCGTASQACVVGKRTYSALMPKGDGPFPVVLFFHGSGQSGAGTISNGFLADPLLKRGYALIAPDALEITYSGGRTDTGWIWEGRRGMRDDYRFVQSVLTHAGKTLPIDPDRILIAGVSNGATFAWYLACANRFPKFRFFAPIAGTPVRNRPLKCRTVRPRFSLMHMHGTADTVVPSTGTQASDTWPGWLGAGEAVAGMAERASCFKSRTDQDGSAEVTTWTRCRAGNSLRLVLVPDGHYIPVDWGDRALDWFEELSAARGAG